jgi:quinol monooxygenase YgiN
MGEVVVAASFKVRPGREQEAEEALREVARATHEEDGCLLYALHRGVDDPGRFVLLERWRSREDLDAHLQQPYVARLAATADALEEPAGVWFTEALPEGDPEKGALS